MTLSFLRQFHLHCCLRFFFGGQYGPSSITKGSWLGRKIRRAKWYRPKATVKVLYSTERDDDRGHFQNDDLPRYHSDENYVCCHTDDLRRSQNDDFRRHRNAVNYDVLNVDNDEGLRLIRYDGEVYNARAVRDNSNPSADHKCFVPGNHDRRHTLKHKTLT